MSLVQNLYAGLKRIVTIAGRIVQAADTVGQDRRTVGETRPLLLAAAG
jgi:hypothetical protein